MTGVTSSSSALIVNVRAGRIDPPLHSSCKFLADENRNVLVRYSYLTRVNSSSTGKEFASTGKKLAARPKRVIKRASEMTEQARPYAEQAAAFVGGAAGAVVGAVEGMMSGNTTTKKSDD